LYRFMLEECPSVRVLASTVDDKYNQNCDSFKFKRLRRVCVTGAHLLKFLSEGIKMQIEDR
jgi:hypothetical protein